MKIIKYIDSAKILIEFQDEYKYKTYTTYGNFKKGSIINLYSKTVCGVGYRGMGKHISHIGIKNTPIYETWKSMLIRCYSEKDRYLHPAYAECTVCEEWHNFQNFADWYENNFYDIGDGTRMHIDKDVIVKGNKIYSPETCIILPQRINMIFMEKAKKRDMDLPNAIYRCVKGYKASYNGKSLGVFKTLESAIEAHDKEMRVHIKQVARDYKDRLPPYIYDVLLKW